MTEFFRDAKSIDDIQDILNNPPPEMPEDIDDEVGRLFGIAKVIARYGRIKPANRNEEAITAEELGLPGGPHYGAQYPLEKGTEASKERDQRTVKVFMALLDRFIG